MHQIDDDAYSLPELLETVVVSLRNNWLLACNTSFRRSHPQGGSRVYSLRNPELFEAGVLG